MDAESDRAGGADSAPANAAVALQGALQPLQRGQGAPLHHQLFLILRDGIQTGRYPNGKTLPSEGELARLFGVSRITVRAALSTVESAGLIERRQGIGTFVTSGTSPLPIHASMSDVLTHMQEVGRRTRIELVEFGIVPAPPHVRTQFGATDDELFVRAVRVRHSKLQPVMRVTTYLPLDIGQRFTASELEHYPLTQLMKKAGFALASGEQVVTATLADPVVACQLAINVGAALLLIKRLHFDANRRPVQYLETLASPTTFELRMSLEPEDFPV